LPFRAEMAQHLGYFHGGVAATLLVCQGVATVGDREVALMLATMMAVRARSERES